MYELIVIGAGPHALSLLSTLLETRPDKYLEHPDNGLLFYRTRTNAGDSTKTSRNILARGNHYDVALRQRKAEREGVEKVLRGLGRRGSRLRVGSAAKYLVDGDVDERVRDSGGLGVVVGGKVPGLMGPPVDWMKERIVVLDRMKSVQSGDEFGGWMTLWRKQMEFLRVPHLRSPVSHHPDPIDRFILWQYAMAQGRTSPKDLVPLRIPRDPSYTGPFLLPSTDLFFEFCGKSIVEGFALDGIVEPGDVTNLSPISCGCSQVSDVGIDQLADEDKSIFCDHFEIGLNDGRVMRARNVVLATGTSSAERNIPTWVKDLQDAGSEHPRHCLAHCFDIALDPDTYLEPLRKSLEPEMADTVVHDKSVVIIGGGITSIHLSRVALDLGCKRVLLLTRSRLRIQPFDVDIAWLGPRRPTQISAFWSDRDRASRANRLRKARFPPSSIPCTCSGGGATVTQEALDLIQDGLEDGRMSIMQEVEVMAAEWVGGDCRNGEGKWELYMSEGFGCEN
ncbi:hypothetical protein HK104_009623 [Borealophlyctis nickersoniae]|nr:hypothetical protein HK104_009623 [Borealophlyctis nickersoniae]